MGMSAATGGVCYGLQAIWMEFKEQVVAEIPGSQRHVMPKRSKLVFTVNQSLINAAFSPSLRYLGQASPLNRCEHFFDDSMLTRANNTGLEGNNRIVANKEQLSTCITICSTQSLQWLTITPQLPLTQ